jgi:hypothetical protein
MSAFREQVLLPEYGDRLAVATYRDLIELLRASTFDESRKLGAFLAERIDTVCGRELHNQTEIRWLIPARTSAITQLLIGDLRAGAVKAEAAHDHIRAFQDACNQPGAPRSAVALFTTSRAQAVLAPPPLMAPANASRMATYVRPAAITVIDRRSAETRHDRSEGRKCVWIGTRSMPPL